MPRDQEYGIDLAERLSSRFTGMISDIKFTYDGYLDLELLDPGTSYCVVTLLDYNHDRLARSVWKEAIGLTVTLVSRAGTTSSVQWVGDWLDDWDNLVRWVREEPIFNKHKPTSVESDERYDRDLFHNNSRLVTQINVRYLNVEVV